MIYRSVLLSIAVLFYGCQSVQPGDILTGRESFSRAVVRTMDIGVYPNINREYETDLGYLDRLRIAEILASRRWRLLAKTEQKDLFSPAVLMLTEREENVALFLPRKLKRCVVAVGGKLYETEILPSEKVELEEIVEKGRNDLLTRQTIREWHW